LVLTKRIVRPLPDTSSIFPRHFFLEFEVADGKHFIHKQDVGFKMSCDSKGEAHLHPLC